MIIKLIKAAMIAAVLIVIVQSLPDINRRSRSAAARAADADSSFGPIL